MTEDRGAAVTPALFQENCRLMIEKLHEPGASARELEKTSSAKVQANAEQTPKTSLLLAETDPLVAPLVATGDPVVDKLYDAIRLAPKGMTRTQIRDYFNRHKQKGEIDRALSRLVALGHVEVVREETGGRPAERYIATTK